MKRSPACGWRVVTGTVIGLTLTGMMVAPDAAAEPLPINDCQAISVPGSYVVQTNLPGARGLLPDGNCLEFSIEDVTIDLAGFEINGAGSTGIGIAGNQRTGEVRNGSVRGFLIGVEAANVENIRSTDNSGDGIFAVGIVKNNTAISNGGRGFLVAGLVISNRAEQNKSDGFTAGTGAVLMDNIARSNSGNGITSAPGNTVSHNIAVANTGTGIFVTCPATVVFNTATGNGTNISQADASLCAAADNAMGSLP